MRLLRVDQVRHGMTYCANAYGRLTRERTPPGIGPKTSILYGLHSMRGNHACVEGSMMSNCPICFEYLFDSVRPIAVLRCGHTIHEECFKDMTRHAGFKCPICNQAAVDMEHTWQYLDEEVFDGLL